MSVVGWLVITLAVLAVLAIRQHQAVMVERERRAKFEASKRALEAVHEHMGDKCTCDVGEAPLVHDGDCPRRCAYWERDPHSDAVAQCDRVAGHADDRPGVYGGHTLNLYRGSPSGREKRGATPYPASPLCDDPVPTTRDACQYHYLDADNPCQLTAHHRPRHYVLRGGEPREWHPDPREREYPMVVVSGGES